MGRVAGKTALITGGALGIGRATAELLAREGANVVVTDVKEEEGLQAVEAIRAQGGQAIFVLHDAADEAQWKAAIQAAIDQFGQLDILVNNAGIALDDWNKAPSEQPLETWRQTFETNVFGLVEVTHAFLPLLRASSSGRIVNVSSVLGSVALQADPASDYYAIKLPAYNASKSAVNAWTVQLAYELRDTGIKVNAIHPGNIKTDMNPNAELDVGVGARSSVEMALLGADGPTGTFTHLGETLPW